MFLPIAQESKFLALFQKISRCLYYLVKNVEDDVLLPGAPLITNYSTGSKSENIDCATVCTASSICISDAPTIPIDSGCHKSVCACTYDDC